MKSEFDFSECDANKARLDAYRPLPTATLKSLRDYYRIGLTYTSNALEGNSLTESETKIVIEDGLTIGGKPFRDACEAIGHARAYDHVYDLLRKKRITEDDILQLHAFFYGAIDPKKAGCYRKERIFLTGSAFALPPPAAVPKLMASFVRWWNQNEHDLHPVEFAALAHLKFVSIHPFIDGNGRVSRLLMNLALLRAGYTIAIIPPILRRRYLATLEQAHAGKPSDFIEFIRDCVTINQDDLLRLLGGSGGVKNGIGGVNGGVKNDARQNVLLTIHQLPGINAKGIARQLALPLRTVQRHLQLLTADGRIAFEGAPKTGGYIESKEK